MSTFRLNSGGNLVCLSSLASMLDAIFTGCAVTIRGTAKTPIEQKGRTRATATTMLQIAFVAVKVPVLRRSGRADYSRLVNDEPRPLKYGVENNAEFFSAPIALGRCV
jgi:hypothetical protein